MRIRRLGWAGIEIRAAGQTAVIDLLEDASALDPWLGDPRTALPAPSGSADLALVTHLHLDHADPAAVARALRDDGVLLRPAAAAGDGLETAAVAGAEAGIADSGVRALTMEPWETTGVGAFEVTALPAADGTGDPQLSWVVKADDRRIAHFGDTLFHGWWWLVAQRHGPIDVAFLPINAAVVDLPHRQPPSPLPAALDPRQAAVAASALGARLAVPIHYATFHRPPTYAEVDDPAGAFARECEDLGVEARLLEIGEELDLAALAV